MFLFVERLLTDESLDLGVLVLFVWALILENSSQNHSHFCTSELAMNLVVIARIATSGADDGNFRLKAHFEKRNAS